MTAHTTHVQSDAYKWLVLTLAAYTFTFVVAIPQMSLPVLFDEISADLGSSLVQIGWIWGVGFVMGILVGLIGGPVPSVTGSDRGGQLPSFRRYLAGKIWVWTPISVLGLS